MSTEADLKVKIGADSSGLGTALESANRDSGKFSSNLKTSLDGVSGALGKLNDSLDALRENSQRTADATSKLQWYADFAKTVVVLDLLVKGVEALGHGAASLVGGAASGVKSVVQSVIDAGPAFDGYARSVAFAEGPVLGVKTANEGLIAALGRASIAASDYIHYLDLQDSAALKGAESAVVMAGKLGDLNNAANAGGFLDGVQVLQKFTAELTKLGLSDQAAAALESHFATLPGYTTQLNEALVKAVSLTATSADEAKQLGEQYADLFKNIDARGGGFLQSVGGDRGKELADQFEEAKKLGDEEKEQRLVLEGIVEQEVRRRDSLGVTAQHYLKQAESLGVLSGLATWYLNTFDRTVTAWNAMRPAMNVGIEDQIRLNKGVGDLGLTLEQVQRRAAETGDELAKSFSTPEAQLEKLEETVNKLTRGLDALRSAASGAGGALGMSAEALQSETTRMSEALDIAKDKQKQLNDQMHGGSDLQKLMTTLAKEQAAGLDDQLKRHERITAELKNQLAQTSEPNARRAVEDRIAAEESSAREARIARQRAAADAEAAQTEGDYRRRYQILKSALDQEAGLRAGEPDKLREVNSRKLAAEREFTTAQLAEIDRRTAAEKAKLDSTHVGYAAKSNQLDIQAAREKLAITKDLTQAESLQTTIAQANMNIRVDGEQRAKTAAEAAASAARKRDQETNYAIRESAKEQMLDVQELERTKTISSEEAHEKRLAVIREERAAISGFYDTQLALYARDKQVYEGLQRDKIKADLEFKRQEKAEQVRETERLNQEAQTAAGSLTNGLEGAISSVLQKKSPWKPLADSLLSTISSALANNLKSVLTAGLEQAGIGSIINGVLSGSSLSGLLSGGAAGGAGAAAGGGGGLLSGIGGMFAGLLALDTGAWEVKSQGNVDGKGGFPALLHPGEMVIPAGPAANIRQTAADGGSLGGGGSPTVHAPVSFHIHATDPESFMSQLKGQAGKDLMKMMADHVRAGAHLGLGSI